jgi:hypothetical protein
MKDFRVTTAHETQHIQAEWFQQVGNFISFYIGRPAMGSEKRVTALVCLGPGDSVIEIPGTSERPDSGSAWNSASRAAVLVKHPNAQAVFSEQQGWLIVENDDTLNIACGPRQSVYCYTMQEAWNSASALLK